MQIRTAEKMTMVKGICGLVVMICVSMISSASLDGGQLKEVLQGLLLSVGFIAGAVCFAIFAQGSLLFTNKLSRYRLYSAVLFAAVGLLDVLHITSLSGVHLFGLELQSNTLVWLVMISHGIGAAGVLFIFSSTDKEVGRIQKITVLTTSLLLVVVGLYVIGEYQSSLPLVLNQNTLNLWHLLGSAGVLLLYVSGLAAVLYKNREQRSTAVLSVISALVFMMMGHCLTFISEPRHPGIAHLTGEIFMMMSYYFILDGVLKLTIEEPLRRQQLAEEKITHLVYHDDLTGLPNRRRLKEMLKEQIENSRISKGSAAVIIVNINRFKAINDSLGYSAGDRLLKDMGARLTRSCTPAEQVYRMGEDEFAVIVPGVSKVSAVHDRMDQLLAALESTIVIENSEYHLSVSLGLALFPEDGDTADQLLQNADMAVHNAKEQGIESNRYRPSMQVQVQSRLKLENDLRKGIERQEFFLEFQPQIHLDTGKIVGMEALVRWNHPHRGLISPAEFIPLAEESGLIVPLGDWVLRTACLQNKSWQMQGFEPICISVNLSMRQFRQAHLTEYIRDLLTEIGLNPKYLELEITESMTFDKETAFDQLRRLKELGVHISIDDFGTGYSSLHYLKSLPIDRLKIDRSFVKEVMEDNNDAAIVSTITSMAHHLKLKVTAEGVESQEQLEFLKLQRCHEGQGYLFSKPLGAQDIEARFLCREAV
ncbi:EAL domain-containing protein [Paenibacillus sp. YPG26]|uniref:putative bifunctional diguanylate cyclase/phosphodiesterase n=1 Tax=Paenibacillus sp. YPG26 TaxID=2878915 RepID=UPI00203C15EB|nr:EAL domain-containing protein [Paenibacillus sp. YPG26]USB34181.1 EAL domain-containing protein [Paenibacillus sp. YPG26]